MQRTGTLPKLGFHVPFGFDQNVDERAVIEVLLIELGRHAALVERASFFNLFRKGREQVIALDALQDLLFVVERKIAGNGTREPARSLFRFDQGHLVVSSSGFRVSRSLVPAVKPVKSEPNPNPSAVISGNVNIE